MSVSLLIEVAYATPEKQRIVECEIAPGTSAREAVRRSGIVDHFPEINPETAELGVFGKRIMDDYELGDGDRIEIYRPLIADPKEVRRQRAARGLQTRKGGGAINPE